MDVLDQIRKAKAQVKGAVGLLDKEIAATEKRLEVLRGEREAIMNLDAPVARSKSAPKKKAGDQSPVAKQLDKLGQAFSIEEARKAFGKKTAGIRLAQLSRRGVIKKTGEGQYSKVAA